MLIQPKMIRTNKNMQPLAEEIKDGIAKPELLTIVTASS